MAGRKVLVKKVFIIKGGIIIKTVTLVKRKSTQFRTSRSHYRNIFLILHFLFTYLFILFNFLKYGFGSVKMKIKQFLKFSLTLNRSDSQGKFQWLTFSVYLFSYSLSFKSLSSLGIFSVKCKPRKFLFWKYPRLNLWIRIIF